MKFTIRLFVALFALVALAAPAFAQGAASPAGIWDGVVSVSNNTIEIPFTFEVVAANGSYRGYLWFGKCRNFCNCSELFRNASATLERTYGSHNGHDGISRDYWRFVFNVSIPTSGRSKRGYKGSSPTCTY